MVGGSCRRWWRGAAAARRRRHRRRRRRAPAGQWRALPPAARAPPAAPHTQLASRFVSFWLTAWLRILLRRCTRCNRERAARASPSLAAASFNCLLLFRATQPQVCELLAKLRNFRESEAVRRQSADVQRAATVSGTVAPAPAHRVRPASPPPRRKAGRHAGPLSMIHLVCLITLIISILSSKARFRLTNRPYI